MKHLIITAILLITFQSFNIQKTIDSKKKNIYNENYKYTLVKAQKEKGVILLFPCFSCNSKNTLKEFKIDEIAVKNGYSVIAIDYNYKLFLTANEKNELTKNINSIFKENNLTEKNVFIGGFSSGGNVSLLLSNHLIKTKNRIQPKGVFIVDSPVDLHQLYKNCEKNIENNFWKELADESKWITEFLDYYIGNTNKDFKNYEIYAPYTFKTQNIANLKYLQNINLRFYTEPELDWRKEKANVSIENTNTFMIRNLTKKLKKESFKVELIETKNKGYRSSGIKNPHSWSIVDKKELIEWLEKMKTKTEIKNK